MSKVTTPTVTYLRARLEAERLWSQAHDGPLDWPTYDAAMRRYWSAVTTASIAEGELLDRTEQHDRTQARLASARATTPKAVALRSTPVTTTTQAGVRRLLTTL